VLRQIQNTARVLARWAQAAADTGSSTRRRGHAAAPPDDVGEVNDDIKWVGRPAWPTPTAPVRITASADHEDDREDVYRCTCVRANVYRVRLEHRTGRLDLYLWVPGPAPSRRTVRTCAATWSVCMRATAAARHDAHGTARVCTM